MSGGQTRQPVTPAKAGVDCVRTSERAQMAAPAIPAFAAVTEAAP
jgi:hypothetical protein